MRVDAVRQIHSIGNPAEDRLYERSLRFPACARPSSLDRFQFIRVTVGVCLYELDPNGFVVFSTDLVVPEDVCGWAHAIHRRKVKQGSALRPLRSFRRNQLSTNLSQYPAFEDEGVWQPPIGPQHLQAKFQKRI